ncbi:unnamed protein product [Rotaria socialis]|uniref:Helicase C-terminal domain-containing protein n=1 Tax=Rotaria socialis TaxID=392032 RepID=A0A821PHH9_9BILA|nr:unnamed protein product [Rotaria socialis]CAF4802529.1 unnamed protein product [Rotaria socialis]
MDGQTNRVKITGFGSSITVGDLSKKFEVSQHRITFTKSQTQSSKWYAFIDGFESYRQANNFVSKWSTIFTDAEINLTCELDTDTTKSRMNELTSKRNFNSNRSTNSHESDDDTPMNPKDTSKGDYQRDFDDSYSNQPKTSSKRTSCRHGDSCFSADCPYKHSRDWRACKNGTRCNDYTCSDNHPPSRKGKCRHGNTCRKADCLYLHPIANKSKHPDQNDSQRVRHYSSDSSDQSETYRQEQSHSKRSYSNQQSNEDDFGKESLKNTEKIHSKENRHLKSIDVRMVERKAADLPIFASRTKFCERLQQDKLLLVMTDTESDASTQLPQYVAECFPDDLIVCVEQHSIAARTFAHRVADEYDGTEEGDSIGYLTGATNRQKRECVTGQNIMYMTDTALIHEFQTDSNLNLIRVLIIDNVHERSLNIDIVMGIAKLLLSKRKIDFYVVLIASIHIDSVPFLNFFHHSSSRPLIIKSHTYKVAVENQPPPIDCPEYKLIEAHVIPTLYRLYSKHDGHTLIFLSGQRDIEKALQIFNSNIPNGCVALPFYGSLSPEEQNQVLEFDRRQPNKRMVVFCTNILESSFTLKDVQLVIDTGLVRQLRFDSHNHLNILETVRISRFSADQRRDRVSHGKHGHCARLYNDDELKEENIVPEILYVPLDLVILQLKCLHLDIHTFPFMTKPDSGSLRSSLDRLTTLMCIDKEEKLTRRGELSAALSLRPRFSAFMINIYIEHKDNRDLLSRVAAIVAILSIPTSLFLINDTTNDFNDNICHSTMADADEYNSDLFNLCKVFNDWRTKGTINRTTHKCITCNKSYQDSSETCQTCRKKHSFMNKLNNQVLQLVENSIKFYIDTITDSRWKLTTRSKTDNKKSSNGDIIGEHLQKLFPDHIGHLLVSHLPDEGIRLIACNLRAIIDNRSIYVQRAHDDKRKYFVAMLIARSLSGKYIVNGLHQISTDQLPESPIEQLIVRENIGRSVNKEIRIVFNSIRLESWAKWLSYEYDPNSCRLTIWGLKTERSQLESILQPILTSTHYKTIEFGSIRATFQNGLICSAMELIADALRLHLQRVPCKTYEKLQQWLKVKLDLNRHDIKENNFQESKSHGSSDDDDDNDDDYEAPPFYILLKSTDAFQKAAARLPSHYLCPQAVLSSSTTGTHMNEKDAWGRHLTLTIPQDSKFMTDKEILNHLVPHAIDCRQYGKRSIKAYPAIQIVNLPRDANETFIRQILQPVNPIKISLRHTHTDGTGSSSAHIFFAEKNARQQAIDNLQSDFCQNPIQITVRNGTSHKLVKKQVVPILTELESKNSETSTFLITATNRESALQIYKEIIPNLEPSWQIDGSATVTVTHPHLYPDFDTLIQQIATKLEVQVQQQALTQKQHKGHASIRCYFNHGTPQKTALAAATLAQATSPIIIKMINHRQAQLFDELFSKGIIQDWSNKLKLEVMKKEKSSTWVEVCGPQVQQGQLMRQIADYSDTFDERFRVLELNSTTANFFGRKKLADSQLQATADQWINWGCHVSYISKTKSIVIYAEPETQQKLIDSCETDVKHILNKISTDSGTTRNQKKCVFCDKTSYSTNTLRACGHAYCQCASTYLLDTYPLQCNESKCKMNIDMDDLFEIFREREKLMRACKKSLQIYLKTDSSLQGYLFCPNPSCEGLIKANRGYQICVTCGRDVCPLCSLMDDELHQGRTCDERNMVHRMGDFLPNLFKNAETFARANWAPGTPPIIRIDYNMSLADQCPSMKRFYKGVETLGHSVPPDMARGFFTFHGTAPASIIPICTNGFDPARRAGQAYGVGEYFGVTSAVSHGYSCRGSAQGPFSMIIAFLLSCPQLSTHAGFCHVMNNPIDWSCAFNLPVLVVSYGNQTTCPSPF